MASNTPNLNLLKKDPVADGNDTFNIQTMLNENWDKIDAAVGNMDIPDASLTVKGKVQLSNATDSNAEDKAATSKAVKDVAFEAKSYTDHQINLVTETGIPKLVSYPLKVTATTDNQKVFEIPLDLFDANTDTLLVAINRAVLDPTQYLVTNTVRNNAGEVTLRAKITLLIGVAATSEVTMVVLKNVPLGEEGAINGAVLAVDSVPMNRVNGLQEQLNELFTSGNDGKSNLEAAIIAAKGKVSKTESVATFDELKTAIPSILSGSTADATATAAQILSGYTAYINGQKIAGSMINQGSKTATLTTQGQQYTIPAGYHDGNGKITATFTNLVADNIKNGVNIGGVIGTLNPSGSAILNYSPTQITIPNGYMTLLNNIITVPSGVKFLMFQSDLGRSSSAYDIYSPSILHTYNSGGLLNTCSFYGLYNGNYTTNSRQFHSLGESRWDQYFKINIIAITIDFVNRRSTIMYINNSNSTIHSSVSLFNSEYNASTEQKIGLFSLNIDNRAGATTGSTALNGQLFYFM